MKKYNLLKMFFGFSLLLFLPNCERPIGWAKKTFNQGTTVKNNKKEVEKYIKESKIYDEFKTVGMATAMWLSEEVRVIHGQIAAKRLGLDEQKTADLISDAIMENRKNISFYVLGYKYDDSFKMLTDPACAWSVRLRLDDEVFINPTIKSVELDPEYNYLFKHHYSFYREPYLLHFREPYLITFDMSSFKSAKARLKDVNCMKLEFVKVDRIGTLTWGFKDKKLLGSYKAWKQCKDKKQESSEKKS
ncbi:MAG: hypothetical protein UR26_C0004G0010 [candidate division TM6 bacterium GW2011_GWF2_32_72]|nr:MAG: hypothetical protein UR26_C0004G0010 [candidate division TM6 bacterium GW2011_GWF2_32_72]